MLSYSTYKQALGCAGDMNLGAGSKVRTIITCELSPIH